jgi:chemotaxis protein methyltransferase CheR
MVKAGGSLLSPAELAALAAVSGIALAAYRPEHVARCVRRAMARHGLLSGVDLAQLGRRSPAVLAALRGSILVPSTGALQDPAQFEVLRRDLLPGLTRGRPGLRVWSAGCCTGGELYQVGQLLRPGGTLAGSRLLGSDLLARRIQAARQGPPGAVPVPADLRAVLRWECRDLIREPPPAGRFDLVLCRNVAIYLAPGPQRALYAKLAGALRRDGVLLLGRSERLLDPQPLGLVAVAPHAYRKEAVCGAA